MAVEIPIFMLMVNERVYLKFPTLHTNDGGPSDEHSDLLGLDWSGFGANPLQSKLL